jgi:putative intracellular protease/amidase
LVLSKKWLKEFNHNMKTIYLYVLNTMADWEVGHAIAELHSQRFFAERKDWLVKTFSVAKEPIVTMGGVTIVPDLSADEVKTEDAVMLILPGADIWMDPSQAKVLDIARRFLSAEIPVAAICGATIALAEAGMLDNVKHTSNGLPYLKMVCPHYKGDQHHQNELAVTDKNLITAGSTSQVELAYHILRKLEVFEPDTLEYWYGYFGKHSVEDLLKLFEAVQSK